MGIIRYGITNYVCKNFPIVLYIIFIHVKGRAYRLKISLSYVVRKENIKKSHDKEVESWPWNKMYCNVNYYKCVEIYFKYMYRTTGSQLGWLCSKQKVRTIQKASYKLFHLYQINASNVFMQIVYHSTLLPSMNYSLLCWWI